MSDKQTIADVIEEHRQIVGADRVHVTLGPKATPENIREALAGIREENRKLALFTDLEREQAKVARLRARFREITKLCQRRIDEELTPKEGARRLSEIFGLSDLIADVVPTDDIAWMISERERRGDPLPVGI